jgi:lantibiotic modifying enzyme
MLGGLDGVVDELTRHIDANSDSPVLEFMWGSPGTMTAAVWLYERTGNAIWAERFCRDAAWLWDRLEFVDKAGCHLWVQHLYGHVSPFIGAVHGFAGNAFALLRGWDLLTAAERTRWAERLAQSLRATAIREEDGANWPQSIGRHRSGRRSALVQHCHGAPGIVTCFGGFPDAGIDDLLLAAGELTWRAGPLAKGAGLCHGTAGNGYAFLKLYRRSGDKRWLSRARNFAMHAIGQHGRDTARHGQYRYPLWTGDPGLAIYLANCIAGTDRFPVMDFFFGS